MNQKLSQFLFQHNRTYNYKIAGALFLINAFAAPFLKDFSSTLSVLLIINGAYLFKTILSEEEQELREKQLSQPTAPAAPKVSNDNGRPAGTKTKTNNLIASEDSYSRAEIQSVIYAIENLNKFMESKLRKVYSKKRLSKQHKEMLSSLSESIVMSKNIDQWESSAEACIKDFNNIESLDFMPEILELGEEHKVVSYPAAILYHSKKK